MRPLAASLMAVVALASVAGAASAGTELPWDGGYLGVNLGDTSSSTCNTWVLTGAMFTSAAATAFNNRDCSTGGALVGGLHAGENYQFKRLVVGVGADLEFWSAKELSQTVKYSGAVPPAGTYVYSGRQSPGGFAVVGPRIGYAGNTWLPYLRVGAVLAAGSHFSAVTYTPAGAAKATASYTGGKVFSTAGWAVGGGFELGLNGAWSITAEFLHMSLGKGSDTASTCNGSAGACTAFAGVTFDNTHEGFSANVFRVGLTYWFSYWSP